jgi:hypothetical protein
MLRLLGWPVDTDSATVLAIVGAAGLVIDLVLKLALSRACGRALRRAVDLEAAKANRSASTPLALHLD